MPMAGAQSALILPVPHEPSSPLLGPSHLYLYYTLENSSNAAKALAEYIMEGPPPM